MTDEEEDEDADEEEEEEEEEDMSDGYDSDPQPSSPPRRKPLIPIRRPPLENSSNTINSSGSDTGERHTLAVDNLLTAMTEPESDTEPGRMVKPINATMGSRTRIPVSNGLASSQPTSNGSDSATESESDAEPPSKLLATTKMPTDIDHTVSRPQEDL